MKILFVALTKHQYRYFKELAAHLPFESKLLFLPTLSLDRAGFEDRKKIDYARIVARKFKEVDAKYNNPLKRYLYKHFLKVQIPLSVAAISKAIRTFDPDVVAFWNGKKFHQALGVEVAKLYGKKSLFFENGLLPDTTQMDFQGVNASNSVPRDVDFYKKLQIEKACRLPKKLQVRTPKKRQRTLAQSALPQRYIFVPFQVAYDTQIIQHSPWIEDMVDFFEIIEEMAQKTGLEFVIKEHPSDRVSDYGALHECKTTKIHFSTENTQKLIENADAVLTINSTVGIEGLLLGKRVIVLGEAFFTIEGIVKTAKDRDTLLQILQTLETWTPDSALVQKFLQYLYCVYLIPGSWKNPDEKHFDAITKRLQSELS